MPTKTKRQIWVKARSAVNELGDGLGYRVDPGIRDMLASFHVNGLSTTASCEGHSHRGLSHPWIDVGVLAPPDWGHIKEWVKDVRKINVLRKKNFVEAKKVYLLLEEFYRRRTAPPDARLILERMALDYRLQSAGASMTEFLLKGERLKKIRVFQKEMNAFGAFLKKRFFEKK
ncbi:MAG: hypothetical protein ABIO72_03875 [Patescibacteria group bacterium]